MPATSTFSVTGNINVDALLQGIKWTSPVLTFSFPSDPTFYGVGYGSGEPSTFTEANAAQKAAVRWWLAYYARVTGFTFTEVTETASVHGDIRVAMSALPSTSWAYTPSASQLGGDVWIGSGRASNLIPSQGNYGFYTIGHELGHAIGMKHPHETGGPAPAFAFGTLDPNTTDAHEHTLMSYRSYPTGGTGGVVNEEFGFPQTLMNLDVPATQYLGNGENNATESGATVYKFHPATGIMDIDATGFTAPGANRIFLNLWDGGGTNRIDGTLYSTAYSINLSRSAWSTLDASQIVDLGGGHTAPGNFSMPANTDRFQEFAAGSGGGTVVFNPNITNANTLVLSAARSAYTATGAVRDWVITKTSDSKVTTCSNLDYVQFFDQTVAVADLNASDAGQVSDSVATSDAYTAIQTFVDSISESAVVLDSPRDAVLRNVTFHWGA